MWWILILVTCGIGILREKYGLVFRVPYSWRFMFHVALPETGLYFIEQFRLLTSVVLELAKNRNLVMEPSDEWENMKEEVVDDNTGETNHWMNWLYGGKRKPMISTSETVVDGKKSE